eukprot:Pgem_evm2s3593
MVYAIFVFDVIFYWPYTVGDLDVPKDKNSIAVQSDSTYNNINIVVNSDSSYSSNTGTSANINHKSSKITNKYSSNYPNQINITLPLNFKDKKTTSKSLIENQTLESTIMRV